MNRLSRRATLVVAGLLIAIVAIARYLGWLADAPPLLAPGIQ
jgi:hypothetical protein